MFNLIHNLQILESTRAQCVLGKERILVWWKRHQTPDQELGDGVSIGPPTARTITQNTAKSKTKSLCKNEINWKYMILKSTACHTLVYIQITCSKQALI